MYERETAELSSELASYVAYGKVIFVPTDGYYAIWPTITDIHRKTVPGCAEMHYLGWTFTDAKQDLALLIRDYQELESA
jgi:hypothetical protein